MSEVGLVCGTCWHRYGRAIAVMPRCFNCGRVRQPPEDFSALF